MLIGGRPIRVLADRIEHAAGEVRHPMRRVFRVLQAQKGIVRLVRGLQAAVQYRGDQQLPGGEAYLDQRMLLEQRKASQSPPLSP